MTRIAVFDSGVGGLSIYQTIRAQCPVDDIIYLSDNAGFPYGLKEDNWLIDRVLKVIHCFVQKYAPDILVVACNTASTIVLPQLRLQHSLDVVGVVPAIKPAAQQSSSHVIGLLATPATIERCYTKELIKQFANDKDVISIGSSQLVEIAEQKLHGQMINISDIERILQPFISNSKIDSLVLACTHFPLLIDEIAEIFKRSKRHINLVDSRQGIANRVNSIIQQLGNPNLTSEHDNVTQTRAVLTKEISANGFKQSLLRMGLMDTKILTI